MSDDKVIDVAEPTMAVAVTDKALPVAAPVVQQTPAQARIEAVATVLHTAYQKASTLELTPEQVKALKADFPDEAFKLGAGGNDQLIYIEHAYLRDRFDEVLGMGQWALLRSRPHWGEDFEFRDKKGQMQKATRLYADCCLLIKGCLVSEAIGEMIYYHNNSTQSYADAAEGSETAAFRRCAKKIGVGLQAWKKDFCAAWMQKHRNPPAVRVGYEKVSYEKPASAPVPTKPKPVVATEAFKAKMITQLKADPGEDGRRIVTEYFEKIGALIPTEEIEDLPLRFVPVSKEEMAALHKAITDFEAGGEATRAFDPHIEGEPTTKTKQATATQPPPASTLPKKDEPTPFFDVIVPIPRKGETKDSYIKSPDTIGSLYAEVHTNEESRKRLWWLVEKWQPKGWTKKDGIEMPPSAADHAFRKALDDFKAWHEQNHADEKL